MTEIKVHSKHHRSKVLLLQRQGVVAPQEV